MLETARILSFPSRVEYDNPTKEETFALAAEFLATPMAERSTDLKEKLLSWPDSLFAVCTLLRQKMNVTPTSVADDVSGLYKWITEPNRNLGLFDERDYFLGELALIAGTAYRHLGKVIDAEKWLDRADAAHRHTVNPAPALAKIAYARLALRYDMRRYDDVLELLPSVLSSFEKLGMQTEASKSRFLEAMTYKESDKKSEAFAAFEGLRTRLEGSGDQSLLGMVLIEIGSRYSEEGKYEEAVVEYQKALTILSLTGEPMTLAHLKGVVADTYRQQGNLSAAVEAFRSALADYVGLGMAVRVAYYRVILAETLIAVDRPREAEWQILAALPTIEEQKMVPEGFAAIALLRESVHSRKPNPLALRELRDHLANS